VYEILNQAGALDYMKEVWEKKVKKQLGNELDGLRSFDKRDPSY
jgi:hypothetical protein